VVSSSHDCSARMSAGMKDVYDRSDTSSVPVPIARMKLSTYENQITGRM